MEQTENAGTTKKKNRAKGHSREELKHTHTEDKHPQQQARFWERGRTSKHTLLVTSVLLCLGKREKDETKEEEKTSYNSFMLHGWSSVMKFCLIPFSTVPLYWTYLFIAVGSLFFFLLFKFKFICEWIYFFLSVFLLAEARKRQIISFLFIFLCLSHPW